MPAHETTEAAGQTPGDAAQFFRVNDLDHREPPSCHFVICFTRLIIAVSAMSDDAYACMPVCSLSSYERIALALGFHKQYRKSPIMRRQSPPLKSRTVGRPLPMVGGVFNRSRVTFFLLLHHCDDNHGSAQQA